MLLKWLMHGETSCREAPVFYVANSFGSSALGILKKVICDTRGLESGAA
jgi:hypothetical protein